MEPAHEPAENSKEPGWYARVGMNAAAFGYVATVIPLFVVVLVLAYVGGTIVGEAIAGKVGELLGGIFCYWWVACFFMRYAVGASRFGSGFFATYAIVPLVVIVSVFGKRAEQ